MTDYKVLGLVTGMKNNEVLEQGYRLVEFTRDNMVQIGVEQQINNEWCMTQGQWCKEDVIDSNSIAIDMGQGWGVTDMQRVLNKV